MYHISEWGVEYIKHWESFRAHAYLDAADVWTIGYGSTRIDGEPVQKGMVITEDVADELLRQEADQLAIQLERLTNVMLNQNQIDSLVDFMYNLGVGAYTRSSLRAALNTGQLISEDLFTRWNKARDPKTGELVVLAGLTKRRRSEYILFCAPIFQV